MQFEKNSNLLAKCNFIVGKFKIDIYCCNLFKTYNEDKHITNGLHLTQRHCQLHQIVNIRCFYNYLNTIQLIYRYL